MSLQSFSLIQLPPVAASNILCTATLHEQTFQIVPNCFPVVITTAYQSQKSVTLKQTAGRGKMKFVVRPDDNMY